MEQVVTTPAATEQLGLTAEAITRATEPLRGARAVAAAAAASMREELEARPPATPEEAADWDQELWSGELIQELAEKVAGLERDLEALHRHDVSHHVADGVFFEQEEVLDELRCAAMAWMTPSQFGTAYRACELPEGDPDSIAFDARCEAVEAARFVVDCDGDTDSLHLLAHAMVLWCKAERYTFIDGEDERLSPEAAATMAILRLSNERGRRTMATFEQARSEVKAELLELFGNLSAIHKAVGYVPETAE